MRCAAPCAERSLGLRSRLSPVDRRCLRDGKVRIEGKWFCYQHAPIWSRHYAIVRRIRGLRR